MSNTGFQILENDLITVFDSSLKTTLTQNQSTGYVCKSTGKDLGNIFTLFSSLSGGGYTGATGTNCNLLQKTVGSNIDIGSLFVNINTTTSLASGLLPSLPSSSTCKALYACRWVNNAYKGPIFQIKRNQDNITATFYMNALGTAIGTGNNGTGTSLTTWLTQSTPASTIAYVLTWYDQSGNGNNATQSTAPYIPTFDTTTNTVNFSSTFMTFSNTLLSEGNNSFTISYNFVSTNLSSTMNYLYNIGQNTNAYDAVAGGINSTTLNNYFTSYNCYYTPAGNVSTSFLTVTNKYDKTNRYIYYNIPASASTTLATTNLNLVQGTGPSLLGSGGATFGNMSYFTVFNSSLSDSDRSIVESNFSNRVGLLTSLPSSSTCKALYACKWINNAYKGPIFQLQRNQDSVNANFYMNAQGTSIFTISSGNVVSLTSWLTQSTPASTIASVLTWYDQSGSGNDATKITGYIPTFDTATNTVNFNSSVLSLPSTLLSAGNNPYTISYNFVNANLSTSSYFYAIGKTGNNNESIIGLINSTYVTNDFYNFGFGYTPAPGVNPNFLNVTNKYNGTTKYIYYNNSSTVSALTANSNLNLVQATSYLGSSTATSSINIGKMSYFTVFNSTISDSDRSIVESNFSNPVGLLTSLPSSSTCKALYACKWINNAYKGPIFQLQRDQDSVTATFYMNALGTAIGTGSNGTGTSVTTWLTQSTPASTIASVVTWYDQSGNGNNATQISGYLATFDTATNTVNFNKSVMNIPGTVLSAGDNSYTISYNFLNVNLSSTVYYIYNIGTVAANQSVGGGISKTIVSNAINNRDFTYSVTGGVVNSNFLTVTNTYDKTNRYIYYNSSESSNLATTNLSLVQANSYFGSSVATSTYNLGKMTYFTVFNSAISDTDRATVELSFRSEQLTNIANAYFLTTSVSSNSYNTVSSTTIPSWTVSITGTAGDGYYICNGTVNNFFPSTSTLPSTITQYIAIQQNGAALNSTISLYQPVYLTSGITHYLSFYACPRLPASTYYNTAQKLSVSVNSTNSTTIASNISGNTSVTSFVLYSYTFTVTTTQTYNLTFTSTMTTNGTSIDSSWLLSGVVIF